MIFTMKLGFALLEVGSVRAKNTSNILLKNVLDTVAGALIYYAIGYGLQFEQMGGVIGQGNFAAYGFSKPKDYLKLIFYFGFCGTSTTIVSGAVAERMYSDTYLVYAVIMTGFISPIAAGWAWGGGWLQVLGFQDFCGSGVVH
jgi:Amt family ammonium transporter